MKFLIVNADDFGLHPSVNEAIARGFQNGIITSTTLLAGGTAFEDAVAVAGTLPRLGVGIHTALVGGMNPVADPAKVKSLLDENGKLLPDYGEFVLRDLAGEIDYSDVYRELSAQFAKISETGLTLTHVDGHQHLHVWPRVLPIVLALCEKYHIRAMRIPAENVRYGKHLADWRRLIGKTGLTVLANRARRKIRAAGMVTTDHFWGMMDGGHLTERKLLQLLPQLQGGFHELMCHPGSSNIRLGAQYGWEYNWEKEYQALTSPNVYELLMHEGIHRINFGVIGA